MQPASGDLVSRKHQTEERAPEEKDLKSMLHRLESADGTIVLPPAPLNGPSK